MRRSLIVPGIVAVIGLLLLPIDTGIAASVLSTTWQPHLWVAWPAALLLAVPVVYGQIRRPRPESSTVLRRRLDRAARDLADAVERQWTAEAGSRSLHSPAPISVRWSSLSRPDAVDL
jgi:ABC-type spermidine/putrescine transport system permease subunit II